MKSTNWRRCPVCYRDALVKTDNAIREANAAYGVVPVEQYNALANAAKMPHIADTLCENHQMGMTEFGLFYIYYSCKCQDCGYSFEHNHEQRVTEIVRDRPCCECGEDYTCDLLNKEDCGVWCPKCRKIEAERAQKDNPPKNQVPILKHPV